MQTPWPLTTDHNQNHNHIHNNFDHDHMSKVWFQGSFALLQCFFLYIFSFQEQTAAPLCQPLRISLFQASPSIWGPSYFHFFAPLICFFSQASQLIWGPSYLQPRPSYAFHQKLWCIGGCSPHCCPLWSHHPGCSLLQVHSLTFIFLRSKPKEGLCLRKYQSFGFLQMGGFHFGNFC